MNTSDLAEIKRAIRREEAKKQRLCQRLGRARLPFAFDSAELTEMSARDLARKVIQKLGLEESDDPVTALMSYLDGTEAYQDRMRVGGSARDAAGDTGSFLDGYLNS